MKANNHKGLMMSDRRKTFEAVLDAVNVSQDGMADAFDSFDDDCQYATVETLDWPGACSTVIAHKTLEDAEKSFFGYGSPEIPFLIVDLDTGVSRYAEPFVKAGEIADDWVF